MIQVAQLSQFIHQATLAIDGLESSHLIITEGHLANRLTSMPVSKFPTLIAVMPSASSGPSRDADNIQFNNQLLFYILKKISYPGRTFLQEAEDYQQTQDILNALIRFMLQIKEQETCSPWYHLQENSFQIDPEYNYMGCDGWSLAVTLKTTQLEWNNSIELLPTTFTWLQESW